MPPDLALLTIFWHAQFAFRHFYSGSKPPGFRAVRNNRLPCDLELRGAAPL
jgi:hypothetical protein